jgi:putative sterol carrier protein
MKTCSMVFESGSQIEFEDGDCVDLVGIELDEEDWVDLVLGKARWISAAATGGSLNKVFLLAIFIIRMPSVRR